MSVHRGTPPPGQTDPNQIVYMQQYVPGPSQPAPHQAYSTQPTVGGGTFQYAPPFAHPGQAPSPFIMPSPAHAAQVHGAPTGIPTVQYASPAPPPGGYGTQISPQLQVSPQQPVMIQPSAVQQITPPHPQPGQVQPVTMAMTAQEMYPPPPVYTMSPRSSVVASYVQQPPVMTHRQQQFAPLSTPDKLHVPKEENRTHYTPTQTAQSPVIKLTSPIKVEGGLPRRKLDMEPTSTQSAAPASVDPNEFVFLQIKAEQLEDPNIKKLIEGFEAGESAEPQPQPEDTAGGAGPNVRVKKKEMMITGGLVKC